MGQLFSFLWNPGTGKITVIPTASISFAWPGGERQGVPTGPQMSLLDSWVLHRPNQRLDPKSWMAVNPRNEDSFSGTTVSIPQDLYLWIHPHGSCGSYFLS